MANPELKPVENVQNAVKKALTELQPLEAILEGRVNSFNDRSNGEYKYYELAVKSADEYSLPPVISVSQLKQQRDFAIVGEDVVIHVKLGGYPRNVNGIRYITNTHTFLGRID